MALTLEEQVDRLLYLINALPPAKCTDANLNEIIGYTQVLPHQFLPTGFDALLSTKFQRPLDEIRRMLGGKQYAPSPKEAFDDLVPTVGWLRDYVDYTRNTEPPTVFHFFAALSVVGATLARNVYFPRGSGDVFPNLCVVLVAPPGKCKKTTACNLAVNLFRRIGGNILQDKTTPEALIDAFKATSTATGLIYAPEWAVFLGKQSYMEGLVPMLTAWFDCPPVWSSATVMRGVTQLNNVAISHLAATTVDWMQTSITSDVFAGGFMSRLLFVVQHETARRFALPPPLDVVLAKRLVDGLLRFQRVNGRVLLTPDAEKWYIKWYVTRTTSETDKNFAGYFERKPDKLLQLGMLLHVTTVDDPANLTLTVQTLEKANAILTWLEKHMLTVFGELSSTTIGDEQHKLIKQIRAAKGELGYSEWLRMNSTRMNAAQFKQYTDTLQQAKMITFDAQRRRFYILQAGWAYGTP